MMRSRSTLSIAIVSVTFHLFFGECMAHPTPTSAFLPQASAGYSYPQRDFGLQIVPGGCTGANIPAMKTAISDANLLAGAALNAASNFSELPFNYFFKADLETVNTVTNVLRRAQSALQMKGPLINVTCTDEYRACQRSVEHLVVGYTAHTEPSLIVLCALGFTLPRNPKPCTERPGTISPGSILLHELMHVSNISGPQLTIRDLTKRSARDVHNALEAGTNTTEDANAFAQLGIMAWDLGFGGKPSRQRATCVQNFTRADLDATGYSAALRQAAGVDGLRL